MLGGTGKEQERNYKYVMVNNNIDDIHNIRLWLKTLFTRLNVKKGKK